METVFDWITVAIFAGLCVLFLQRSLMEKPTDRIVTYAPAAVGCALANWLGNEGYEIAAVALCAAVIVYIVRILKPFPKRD